MNDDIITITGNIATAPEPRGPGAVAITSFRLASTQRRLDRESGTWVDSHTNWFTVSAYRELAVHALDSLKLGQRVIVTGKLRIRSWENSSGKGTNVDIDADAIGHDLRWGTTEFRKDDRGRESVAPPPQREWDVAVPGDAAQDWAPSLTAEGAAEQPPAAESEPAVAADREPAYAGGEVPF